jgi:hypothetical protein
MIVISKGKPTIQIKPVRKGSKKSLILSASLKGASIEDLMKVTGWARSAALVTSRPTNLGDGLPLS